MLSKSWPSSPLLCQAVLMTRHVWGILPCIFLLWSMWLYPPHDFISRVSPLWHHSCCCLGGVCWRQCWLAYFNSAHILGSFIDGARLLRLWIETPFWVQTTRKQLKYGQLGLFPSLILAGIATQVLCANRLLDQGYPCHMECCAPKCNDSNS